MLGFAAGRFELLRAFFAPPPPLRAPPAPERLLLELLLPPLLFFAEPFFALEALLLPPLRLADARFAEAEALEPPDERPLLPPPLLPPLLLLLPPDALPPLRPATERLAEVTTAFTDFFAPPLLPPEGRFADFEPFDEEAFFDDDFEDFEDLEDLDDFELADDFAPPLLELFFAPFDALFFAAMLILLVQKVFGGEPYF